MMSTLQNLWWLLVFFVPRPGYRADFLTRPSCTDRGRCFRAIWLTIVEEECAGKTIRHHWSIRKIARYPKWFGFHCFSCFKQTRRKLEYSTDNILSPPAYRSLRIIHESIAVKRQVSYPLLCARVDRAKLCSSFITMALEARGGKALCGVVAPVSLSGDKLVYSVCSLLVLFRSWPIRWVSQTTATISICLASTRHFKTICHFD